MQPRIKPHHAAGLTIIEVLVSIALLSVIVLVVLTPLTGFFGLARQSNQQVSTTQAAQRALESLRGDWLNQGNYDKNCLTNPAVLDHLDIEITALDVDNQATGTLGKPGSCAAVISQPPLKRVRITRSNAQGRLLADLTVVVDRR
ncbi:prepilin-type N-terminal cleavage/methylation domain-containing protein [Deinococcus frigens]|uniref:type IV pilus modification PilV family protein n=1 Tax=Deinococcus frigens TaxID=249403 RepID=UPI000497AAF6|nr:prepilin-type N-terminal cleavage/methylation domain-containing protein [Deinococcus frigens]